MRRVARIAVEIVVLVAIVMGVSWARSWGVRRGPAPPLAGVGLDGETLSLASLRGHPALVHFWATWCDVCRAEEHNIVDLAKTTPMITVATSSGDAAAVRAYLASRGAHLPVLVDPDGTLAARFGIGAFPTTLVVDGRGEIRSVSVGYTTELGLRARLLLAR